MAGGGNKPGFAFFAVNEVPGGSADLDYFQAIFKLKLGFEWVNNRGFRNMTLGMWNHERDPSHNRSIRKDECCIMCCMKSCNFKDVEYIVIGISTHGGDQGGHHYLQLFDGKGIYVDEIMEELSDKRFPLRGKKRILIINSCRNDSDRAERAADTGTIIEQEVSENEPSGKRSSTLPIPQGAGDSSRSLLPFCQRVSSFQPQDFLIVCSTTPGRYSYNNDMSGSWMLQDLKETIEQHDSSARLNLFHALTKAAQKMSERETKENPEYSGLKGILWVSSTLTSLPLFTVQRPAVDDSNRMDLDAPALF